MKTYDEPLGSAADAAAADAAAVADAAADAVATIQELLHALLLLKC